MRNRKGAEMISTIPESEIVSCGGFIPTGTVEQQQLQLQHQHSLANVHQWATAAAMNRKSLDDVDLALSKQQMAGNYYMNRGGQLQPVGEEGGTTSAYYYGRAGSAAMLASSGGGGGTLPRNFGGLIKEDKVRPVAKVQAQVVMRQAPSPPLKDAPAYVIAAAQQQQQVAPQPVYVNFGHLSNHVHHHHFYGGDVNTNTIALTALQSNVGSSSSSSNSAIVVNTQAEVHHHHHQTVMDTTTSATGVPGSAVALHHKNDIKVSD